MVGGESNAIKILNEFLKDEKYTANFKKPMTNPTSLKPETTTLSP